MKKLFYNIVNNNDKIIVAVSGGPDSMFLLYNLISLKNEKNLQIICAHVNHQTRKECDEEEKFVKDYCEKNNIIFESISLKEFLNDKFSEEIARKRRIEFFSKLKNKYNANYIMTAHHADDLIETILMKIMRGSTLKSIVGIKEKTIINNDLYIRPMLSLTKNEIVKYLNINNISYCIDQTNYENIHFRNRIRNKILPILKEEDKNIHKKFIKFSKELEEQIEYINEELDEISKNLKIDNKYEIENFKNLKKYLKKEYLKRELNELLQDNINKINLVMIEKIISFIENNKGKNQLEITKEYLIVKNKDLFYFEKKQEKTSYKLECQNNLILPNGYILKKIDKYREKSNYEIHLNSKEIKLPIYITTREIGMNMAVKNLNGTKKVKDILIDAKVAPNKKDSIPIMVDSDNKVLWVLGIKKSKYDLEKNENYDIIYRYERNDT